MKAVQYLQVVAHGDGRSEVSYWSALSVPCLAISLQVTLTCRVIYDIDRALLRCSCQPVLAMVKALV